MPASGTPPTLTRREPPPFRPVRVVRVERRNPRLVRVTLSGDALDGFEPPQPAASVRLLLPPKGGELVLPGWNGNEFLLPDGTRPVIRTLTPRRFDPHVLELDVEVVMHGGGAVSAWALSAEPGWEAAVSGPGRGYAIDASASRFLLAGDETALPAISQLLEALPQGVTVEVHVEVAAPEARVELPPHPGARVSWHDLAAGSAPGDAMVEAVGSSPPEEDVRIWVAGEAAAVQRIRRFVFDEWGVPRAHTTIRGYWKHGRAGGGEP